MWGSHNSHLSSQRHRRNRTRLGMESVHQQVFRTTVSDFSVTPRMSQGILLGHHCDHGLHLALRGKSGQF